MGLLKLFVIQLFMKGGACFECDETSFLKSYSVIQNNCSAREVPVRPSQGKSWCRDAETSQSFSFNGKLLVLMS